MSVNPDDLKAVMRNWASGVTVVTTANDNERAGSTVSSFTSVSVEPPLILVCLFGTVDTTEQILHNGHFAVSVLGKDDEKVSGQMAGFGDVPEGEDRFYGIDWTTAQTGSLIYKNAIGWMDCKLHAVHDGGTHKIIVGEVLAAGTAADTPAPLVYHNRGYRQISTD